MNKTICQLTMALALASLVGCGLKGPLYFPPKDQPQQQPAQQTTQEPTTTQQHASGQDQTSGQPGM
ncbi:LPS translocon maturation chaperone LptM [Pantoea sp. B65]|uniref:LPS translocon maturation chaperone LptM n=1 Tax=Pantoea sp. B65 TaxID=2813359 RepID=UPI0039B58E69